MSKAKVRTTVPVNVEEFDVIRHEVAPIEEVIIERPVFKSDLGTWWEGLCAVVLLVAFGNVIRSGTVFWSRLDIVFAWILVLVGISVAAISGRYAGEQTQIKKVLGVLLVVLGLGFGIVAIAWGPLPNSSHWTSAAIGLTISGWSVRRLLGESIVRSFSLGLAAALPLGFLNGGYLLRVWGTQIKTFVDQAVFWYAGIMADLNSVTNAPIDGGLKFASGDLLTAASFENMSGVLVALGASLGLSIIARHSLLVGTLALGIAFFWWLVFRAAYCVSIGANAQLNGPYSELAMPSYALIGMLMVIAATNICIGLILAPIPTTQDQYEVSSLTQIYNACVSFPQLGPSHFSMVADEIDDVTKHVPQDRA